MMAPAIMRCPPPTIYPLRMVTLLLVALLAACSAVKLAYNNADELIFWALDDYFDFDTSQAQQARTLITRWHARHRRESLPEYAALLRRAAERAGGEIDAAQVCAFSEEARSALAQLAWQFQPLAPSLTSGLGPGQIEHLKRRFAENNAEWDEDWLRRDTKTRDAARLKRLRGKFDRFYGSLSETQVALLREHVAQLPFEAELLKREVLRRQADLLALLEKPASASDSAWRAFFARMLDPPDTAYQAYLARSRHALCQTLSRLHEGAPLIQREHLAATLRDYATDLEALSRQRID